MIKVMFILPSLEAGGAERVVSFIAQELTQEGFDITLLVLGYQKDQMFEVKRAKLVFLEKPRLLSAIPAIFTYIKKSKPDIVMGSIGHVNQLLGFFSFFFPSISFVAREASVGGVMKKFANRNTPLFFKRVLYNRLDMVVCQSLDMKKDFDSRFHFEPHKSVIINNPIALPFVEEAPKGRNKKVRFITVGRLSEEKGQLRVLEVLKSADFDFEYLLIGTGPLREKIEGYINTSQLTDKVVMISQTKEIKKHLAESDFFLQGSYVEGFPNALLEAVSSGVPCIAFDAPGGTKEIIKNSFNGYVVDNAKEFEQILPEAISRKWDSQKIKEDCELRFGRDKIVGEYVRLFNTIFYRNKNGESVT